MTTHAANADLPDLFLFHDGSRVRSRDDWQRRREQLLRDLLDIEYGCLPPPVEVRAEELHTHQVVRMQNATHSQYRLTAGEGPDAVRFRLDLLIPEGDGPFPAVLNGDDCWFYRDAPLMRTVLNRRYILAWFSRVEIAPDVAPPERNTGIYRLFPEASYGALAAWAWGYHRCIDVLVKDPRVDPGRIAIAGHSRGGKTTLLAGATDERIALTCANDSGCGGAGCFRVQGPRSETLADICKVFGFWFAPELRRFVGREFELPFDQHALKAVIAPRALLTTEALGDPWANPSGTRQTHAAASEVYRFLEVPDRIGIWYREGTHAHTLEDWEALLDFADWHFRGIAPNRDFDMNPFPEMPVPFSWRAPLCEG